jgi:predicted RNase H-like HicB family nuclease
MEKPTPRGVYEILAQWDSEAGVWVAESDDVPGLVAEADSPNVLAQRLRTLIPELLELNGVPSDRAEETMKSGIARSPSGAFL